MRGEWFTEAKYAMFIHWGLYSHLAGRWQGKPYYGIGEWLQHRARIPAAEYAKTADEFNPTGFNAREWVALAKAAGMKYIVITSKHHDGFAMFKSAVSLFNIADGSPFQRDPLAELAEACREGGLRLGFYYSQTQDWHETDAVGNTWDGVDSERDFGRYLRAKAIPQIKEILSNYGPVALIWFDTPGPITPQESEQLVELVHALQPDCLVNSRIGNDLGDYVTLGDQEIPVQPMGGLWETVDTHNDTWGYVWCDHNWKSPRELAQRLVRVVSRGGNYMLNIGPDGKGRIPAMSARILREVGAWVQEHSETIYGAQPSPLAPLPWGECTARGNTLYLHVFHYPTDGRLIVPGLLSQVQSARLLGGASNLTVEPREGYVVVRVPLAPPDALIPVIALEMEGEVRAANDVTVLPGCPNRLDITTARLTNCAHTTVHWMEKFGDWQHANCVNDWSAGSAAAWSFTALEPGAYYLDLEYSCPLDADFSEWQITLDDAGWSFPLLTTGHMDTRKGNMAGELPRFRNYRAGLVSVEAGAHTLTIAPISADGQRVHLASVALTPAELR